MSESPRMIKIFQRIDNVDFDKDFQDCNAAWFALSRDYIDFRNQLLTKRDFYFDELWIVHEHYGGEGNFYAVTEHNFSRNAFRIIRNLADTNYNFSKSQLEEYIDTVAISDEYLLQEFKFQNDNWKDSSSGLHVELYQADLNDRIRNYIDAHNMGYDYFPDLIV